jgi:hypothetical protein
VAWSRWRERRGEEKRERFQITEIKEHMNISES